MAYEVSVLPQSVLADPQAVEASLYSHLGDRPRCALQHIRALNADAKLAGLLEVPVGAAVLFITRVGYDPAGQTVELTHSYRRSDYYDFVAEMSVNDRLGSRLADAPGLAARAPAGAGRPHRRAGRHAHRAARGRQRGPFAQPARLHRHPRPWRRGRDSMEGAEALDVLTRPCMPATAPRPCWPRR